jgi:nucleotide-binding universal stress UspA family protein
MFKTILVPTDGSALSKKAMHGAIELAGLASGRIIVVSVAEPYPYRPVTMETAGIPPDQNLYEEQTQKYARMHVEDLAQIAAQAGIPCETRVALSFAPYEEIINAAEACGCDVIVMGSHGHKGLNKLFLGSETQKVLAHTTIPVMVYR